MLHLIAVDVFMLHSSAITATCRASILKIPFFRRRDAPIDREADPKMQPEDDLVVRNASSRSSPQGTV
jgi:hypothetical protein